MLSTFILFAIFGGQLIISAMLWGYLLRLGLLWAGVPDVTTWGVVIATSLWVILGVVINVSFIVAANGSNVNPDGLALMQLVGSIALPSAVICAVFRTRLLRAVQAWLPTLLADFVTLLFVYLVLKPVLYEAFIVPTNGMAPTLLGQHWQAVCPTCGAPNYCTPRDARFGNPGPQPMICENFHVHSVAVVDTTVHDSDRFIVAKFLNPRRWDLVVFQSPEEPSLLFVSRLIGLPGERIHIKDGLVWINGLPQTPPDSIRGIEYLSELPGWAGSELSGSETRPALLGDDEYFVLGDFSAQSSDSRIWKRGAPGHEPFAVPSSYMKGVVTHTYWSISRMKLHR